jgi:hypothetical protein
MPEPIRRTINGHTVVIRLFKITGDWKILVDQDSDDAVTMVHYEPTLEAAEAWAERFCDENPAPPAGPAS